MNDEQFKAIRGLLVTIVILLGLITGILLALVWRLRTTLRPEPLRKRIEEVGLRCWRELRLRASPQE